MKRIKHNTIGHIYALESIAHNGLKVGYTQQTPHERCIQWNASQKPKDKFHVVSVTTVKKPRKIERLVHQLLWSHHLTGEYFDVTADELELLMKYNFRRVNYKSHLKDVTNSLDYGL